MVSTRKQIEVSEGEGTDAKIASLAQQMEKMTLMMAKLVEDLARKPQDEIPDDSRRKKSLQRNLVQVKAKRRNQILIKLVSPKLL
ncbi:hypothetical protein L3X38_042740 [Prunus dulcis]|uniref:Uncharacterized protein n=1 Tax=Prunus dulcis TaxID=3755 RepID=A0AAD4UWV2_PRUDU|nr:hypothetical protein L3X38_042740 [Prunus dulcis]